MASNYAIQDDKSIFSTADNGLSRISSRSDLPSSTSSPLVGERPSTQRKAHIHIQHPQLRDLIHPTEQRGVVYTVQANAVVRYDLRRPNQPPKTVTRLDFNPTTIAYSPSFNLLAVGGPEANLILVQLPPVEPNSRWKSIQTSWRGIRQIRIPHPGRSIINSVSFADLPSSSTAIRETRLLVSSNEQTVRIYRICPPNEHKGSSPSPATSIGKSVRILQEAVVQYNTCVNHASISPDGQTLLSVGDEPEVYLHSLSSLSSPSPLNSILPSSIRSSSPYGLFYSTSDFGYTPSEIRFSMGVGKHTTMRAPRPIVTIQTALGGDGSLSKTKELVSCAPRSLNTRALFSTAWSGDGWKFATGSQDGIVQVWDVRNLRRRLQHFRTIQNKGHKVANLQGEVDSTHPCMGKTWGVRALRFNPSSVQGERELLIFSEHESHLNVVDARTFDPASRQVLHLPSILRSNPIVQNTPKRRGTTSIFHRPLTEEVREGKKRKRSLDPPSPTHPSPARRLTARERVDDLAQPSLQQYTIPGLREVLAQSFDLQRDMDQSTENNSQGTRSSGHVQEPSNQPSSHRTGNDLSSSATYASSEIVGSRGAADATIEQEVADILEASGQVARRLRGVNSQLEQMASSHDPAFPSSSSGLASPSSSRPTTVGVAESPVQSESRATRLVARTTRARDLLSASRQAETTPSRYVRREDILTRLQQREAGSSNATDGRSSGSSLSRTRERIEDLRRARDELAAIVNQHSHLLNAENTADAPRSSGDNDISDEDIVPGHAAEPSFSRDLTRGIMRRWSRPGTNSPLNDQMTTSSNDATTQTEDGEGPSDPINQDDVINDHTDEENDAFWASIGMELDAQSAADMGFEEPSSLRRARLLIDPALAAAGSSDSDTDVPEIPPASAHRPSRNFELNVGRSIPSVFRRVDSTSIVNPVQRQLRATQLQSLRNRIASHSAPDDVSLVAGPRTQTIAPLRSTSFYQHSNEGMDELREISNRWTSRADSEDEPVPLFRQLIESPPVERDARPFAPRSISSYLNEVSARRTRFATTAHMTRPFSSRILGHTSFYGPSFERDGDEDVIDGEDVVMEDEDTPLDIAGIGFGLAGTESQGYLYAGTMDKRGRGGRLIEFDLARGAAVKRNEKESSDEEDDNDSEDDDAWNGRRGNWVGRRYAQGSWV